MLVVKVSSNVSFSLIYLLIFQHRYHDILFGIITLEVLPHEKSPVSIFTYVTPYIDFIKEHVNTRVNPIKYVKK